MQIGTVQRSQLTAHAAVRARLNPPAPVMFQTEVPPTSSPPNIEASGRKKPDAELLAILRRGFSIRSPVPMMKQIIAVVAAYYDLDSSDLTGAQRRAYVVHVRHVGMYLCRDFTTPTRSKRSNPEVGRAFGGRHHTTAMYGCGKIIARLKHDSKLQQQMIELGRILNNEVIV